MNRTILLLLVAGILSWPSLIQAEVSANLHKYAASSGSTTSGTFPVATRPPHTIPDSADAFDIEKFFASSASSDVQALTDVRVAEQVRYFTTSGKPLFQAWLDHSSRFIPLMKAIFREKKLPEDLVYVAMIESGLRMNAVSRSRAVGPWQFMTATAKTYGLKMDYWVDERRDPVKSTKAAAEYLGDLYRRFGSWHLALASYNAGAGKIERALFQSPDNGLPGLYDSRLLQRETRNYVPRLLAAVIIARNPEQYGFVVKNKKSFRYEEVRIKGNTALEDIAVFAGCTYGAIRDLNPELQGLTTPPYAGRYVLRIPVGTKKNYLAVKKLLFRNLSLSKHESDRRDAGLDERPEGYAVLRKRDSSHMVFLVRLGALRVLPTRRKHGSTGPLLPAAAGKGRFGILPVYGAHGSESSRCFV